MPKYVKKPQNLILPYKDMVIHEQRNSVKWPQVMLLNTTPEILAFTLQISPFNQAFSPPCMLVYVLTCDLYACTIEFSPFFNTFWL